MDARQLCQRGVSGDGAVSDPRYITQIIRCGYTIDAVTGEPREHTPEEEAHFLRVLGVSEPDIATIISSSESVVRIGAGKKNDA